MCRSNSFNVVARNVSNMIGVKTWENLLLYQSRLGDVWGFSRSKLQIWRCDHVRSSLTFSLRFLSKLMSCYKRKFKFLETWFKIKLEELVLLDLLPIMKHALLYSTTHLIRHWSSIDLNYSVLVTLPKHNLYINLFFIKRINCCHNKFKKGDTTVVQQYDNCFSNYNCCKHVCKNYARLNWD